MTSNDAKQIRDAFTRLCKAQVTLYKKEQTVKITTDFKDYLKNPIEFYAYMNKGSGKIYFTDAGRMYRLLSSAGQDLQPAVINGMAASYGLTALPDNSILDQQDKPMHERLAAMIQMHVGIDAQVRTWLAYAQKLKG